MINIKYVGCTRPKTLAKLLLSELGSPLAFDLLQDLNENNLSRYFSRDTARSSFETSRDAFIDAQAVSLLKKNPCIISDSIKERSVALFLANEEQCLVTNERLSKFDDLSGRRFHDEFFIARNKIASILGPIPDKALDFGFGPGVSIGKKGVDTGHYAKYDVYRPTITSKALPFARRYLEGTLWGSYLSRGEANEILFDVVEHAEIAFVPKNYKIERCIAVEPLLNTYFQKGLGSYIRDRLSFNGVDLRQQSHNQNAAGRAQDDGLATVDFSSASDTISRQTVLDLLPFDWFHVLDTFRTHEVKMPDGSIKILQKFSSMGNGFTFELESLLFYAAAYAVVLRGSGRIDDIYVYGDDVILPAIDYPEFEAFTRYLGFTVSSEKSFVSGNFFESCGMDYYDGVNIRPFYLKNDLLSTFDIFECHNALLLISERWSINFSYSLGFLQSLVPAECRLFVPFPYSGGFHKATACRDFGITNQGWEGSFHKALSFVPKVRQNEHYEPSILSSFTSPSLGFRSLRQCGDWKVKKRFFPAI